MRIINSQFPWPQAYHFADGGGEAIWLKPGLNNVSGADFARLWSHPEFRKDCEGPRSAKVNMLGADPDEFQSGDRYTGLPPGMTPLQAPGQTIAAPA